jgi:hypothetical protein
MVTPKSLTRRRFTCFAKVSLSLGSSIRRGGGHAFEDQSSEKNHFLLLLKACMIRWVQALVMCFIAVRALSS